MTRATLVARNLRRRLRRTLLTVLGLAVALFLFVTLRTFLRTLQTVGDVGSESRLIAMNKLGMVFPLPLAYRTKLAAVDGVGIVSWASWFGGVYQDPKNFIANFAIDPETYLALYPEIVLPPEQKQAFLADRAGAIVGVRTMERFGWKLGQTVTLRGTIWPGEHRFNIRGVYTAGRKGFDQSSLMFQHRYLDEIARAQGSEGTTGWYVFGVTDPTRAPAIAEAIDRSFENSSAATRTQTEKAFNLSFVGLYGNIGFFLNAIGLAVVFAILLVAANTMAMSARERFGEVAVLKTLGFSDGDVLRLVLAEALVVAGLGLLLGLGGALLLFNILDFDLGGFVPGLKVTPAIASVAVAMALGIAAASGAVPAWQSARLKVVDALRYVA
ncbi:MAG TPA: FtsX-like permease family protein [Longimicrobiales bacterium]|nr:FtsX-like permease family protein [Longimicrobiales bacterium]